MGTFGEITLDKKISRYCPFKIPGGICSQHLNDSSTAVVTRMYLIADSLQRKTYSGLLTCEATFGLCYANRNIEVSGQAARGHVLMSSKSDQAEAAQAHVLSQGRTRGWDCWAFAPVPLESVVQVSKIILSCLKVQ